MRAADTPCMCDAGAQLLIASRKAKAKQLAAHDACQSPILISSTPSHVPPSSHTVANDVRRHDGGRAVCL
jgi:hypothetical protein